MLRTKFDTAFDDREWQEFLSKQKFGQIVALGVGREIPVITPTHYIFDGVKTVEFHVHCANPLLEALKERSFATLTVVDAFCFIPSSWNCEPGEDPRWSAPTSYYAAVHATGETSLVMKDGLADLLNRQTKVFQPEEETHPVEQGNSYFGRALGAIVGVKLLITYVDAKFKFGGNRTVMHRLQIAEHLAERAERGDTGAIFHLLRRAGSEKARAGPQPSVTYQGKLAPSISAG